MTMAPNQTKRRNPKYIGWKNINMKTCCQGLPMEAAEEGPFYSHERLIVLAFLSVVVC